MAFNFTKKEDKTAIVAKKDGIVTKAVVPNIKGPTPESMIARNTLVNPTVVKALKPKIDTTKGTEICDAVMDIDVPAILFSDHMDEPSMLRSRLQQLEGYLQDEGVPIADMKTGLASIRTMLKATPELAAELLEEDIGLITRTATTLTGKKILEKKAPKKSTKKKSYARVTSAGLNDDDLANI